MGAAASLSGEAEPDYLVKWRGLGYASATWESAASLSSPADAAAVARFAAISSPHRRAPAEARMPPEGAATHELGRAFSVHAYNPAHVD